MNDKEQLKKLIKIIRNAKGWTQEKVSKEAGYEPKSLTQFISKESGHAAVIKRLKLVFRDVLNDSTNTKSQNDNMSDENYYKDKYIKLLEKRESENEANLNLVLATLAGNQKILGALYDLVEDSKKDKSVIAIYRKDTGTGK